MFGFVKKFSRLTNIDFVSIYYAIFGAGKPF